MIAAPARALRVLSCAVSLTLIGLPVAVNAQAYPVKPVRFIVPFAPGGGTDIIARSLAQQLTASLRVQTVVDNRPGANGNIGAEQVARAAADGYTLLLTTNAITTNPWLYKNIPYDTERDFAPVTLAGSAPNLLAAHPSVPARTMPQLIALARARPGAMTVSGAGPGTPSHLAAELLKQSAGIDLIIVNYKGTGASGASLSDLIGGQVALSFGSLPGLAPYVKAGRVRALAQAGSTRSPALPHVPLVSETLPGFEVVTWYGVLAPAGTSRDIVTLLNSEIRKALASPDVQQRLAAQGFDAGGISPEQFAALLRSDLARWRKVIRAADIKID
jgi:tripartite-type tricarboxylate transporter receptor subunit TctC